MKKYLRYPDLEERGLYSNPMTLDRDVKAGRFPKPVKLGPNRRAWLADEVDAHEAKLASERHGVAA